MYRKGERVPGSSRRDLIALAVALALHGGASLLLVPASPPLRPSPVVVTAQVEIDLVDGASATVGAPDAAERGERPALGGGLAAGALVASLGRDVAMPGFPAAVSDVLEGDDVGAPGGGDASGAGDGDAPGGGDDSTGDGAESAARGRLSLESLGVGPAGRGATGLYRPRPLVRRSAAERLARSLAQPTAERDVALGLGPHGPVIVALERAARDVVTPLNATALFVARVDREGRVVNLELLETTQDYAAWVRVADRARQALGGRRLTVSDGANGLSMRIRLESREQLPSGADPGLGVSLAGIPLKRGKGDRSPQIDVLKPELKLEMAEVPDPGGSEPVRLPRPRVGLTLLNLGVDPADIGAHAQRIVRAHVESVEVL